MMGSTYNPSLIRFFQLPNMSSITNRLDIIVPKIKYLRLDWFMRLPYQTSCVTFVRDTILITNGSATVRPRYLYPIAVSVWPGHARGNRQTYDGFQALSYCLGNRSNRQGYCLGRPTESGSALPGGTRCARKETTHRCVGVA